MNAMKMMMAAFAAMVVMGIAGVASAQQPTQPQGGSAMGQSGAGSMMGQGMMGVMSSMCSAMTNHVEGRLAFIKAEINITHEQEALWNDYATVIRNSAKTLAASCPAVVSDSVKVASLPDRLEAQEKFVAARLDALRATIKAVKPLYASLSEMQKTAADRLIRGSTGTM